MPSVTPSSRLRSSTGAMPVLGDRRRVRVDLEPAPERKPLLERAAQRKFAQRRKVGVVNHRRVVGREKSGHRDADARSRSPPPRSPWRASAEVTAPIASTVRAARPCRLVGTVSRLMIAAVLSDDSDLGAGAADVDCAGQSHQSAACASSGFFQRSIGLAIPFGRNGSVIFRPSPADAYAA